MNEFAAYFYMIEEPDHDVTSIEIQERRNEANLFLQASTLLLARLNNEEETLTEEVDIQRVFYDVGKIYFGEEKQALRRWFSLVYMLLFRNVNGPRIGVFCQLFGIQNFIERYRNRLENPLELPYELNGEAS